MTNCSMLMRRQRYVEIGIYGILCDIFVSINSCHIIFEPVITYILMLVQCTERTTDIYTSQTVHSTLHIAQRNNKYRFYLSYQFINPTRQVV